MQTPAFAGPAQQDAQDANSVFPVARQGFADLVAGCAALDWAAELVSHRVIKLTSVRGSVLLASTAPETFGDTLRRIADANTFAQRYRRA
jgi:hypothetical protein